MVTKKTNPDQPNPNRRPKPAASRAQEEVPTSASTWKKKASLGTLVTVPSGNVCRVRTPGMNAFLTGGLIPNGLMSIVKESMDEGKAPDAEAIKTLADDPARLQQILELTDLVTISCCVEPVIVAAPTEVIDGKEQPLAMTDSRRDPEVLYVDDVDLNDKLFIFQFATGGTATLEQFRQEQNSGMVALPE